MKIVIETLPKDEPHRCGYSSCGDWYVDNKGVLQVRVTDTDDIRSNLAIAIHEAVEAIYCKLHGITDMEVCQFDAQYEAERLVGKHKVDDEPGDDPRSPYREAHFRSIHVERAVCHALDLLWDNHNAVMQ